MKKIICGICGKKAPPATPLYLMCHACYDLYQAAISPIISMTGHPANLSFYHEMNYAAIKVWEEHLKAHGFVKKHGKWTKGGGK
jgi:hypothetical protein